jgi:tetratricopeptide (TPR) repeat protein/DNA-binding PadR family transcriptional regulator
LSRNRTAGYLRRITLEAKIILILHANRGSEDLMDVDDSITQGGMAARFRIRRNNISRALADLSGRSLIFSRTKHIKGLHRRRKAYFLTPKGSEEASRIIDDISDRYLRIRTIDGDLKELKFNHVKEELSALLHREVPHYEVITGYMEDGLCDLTLLGSDRSFPCSRNIPGTDRFYGREKESDELTAALEKGVNLISILGIAGIGKTTFTSDFFKDSSRDLIWKELDPWMSPDILIDDISSSVGHHGRISRSIKDLYRRSKQLSRELASRNSIVVLDDVHRCGREMMELLSILKELCIKENWTLVVLSRIRPSIYTAVEARSREDIVEITLRGLSRDSSFSFMESLEVPPEERERIFITTEGHPLTISLCSLGSSFEPDVVLNSFSRFLQESILSELSGMEREFMELLSAFDLPVHPENLAFGEPVAMASSLSGRSLVISYPDGSVDLHDSLREGIRKTIPRNRFDDLRKKVLQHYRRGSSDTDMVQFLLLSSMYSDPVDFTNHLLEHAGYLLGRGFHPVARLILEEGHEPKETGKRIEMEVLKYDSASILGMEERAQGYLVNAGSLAESFLRESRDPGSLELTVMVLNRLAERALREGLHRDVIRKLKRGLDLARDSGARDQEARLLSNIGTAYLDLGDPDTALRFFTDSLEIFDEIGDVRGETITRLNMGSAHFRKRELSNALRDYLECIRISEKSDLSRIASQASFRVGKLYRMVKEPQEAARYFSESAVGYARVGDLDFSFMVLSRLLDPSIGAGEREIAISTLEKILRIIRGGGFTMVRRLLRTGSTHTGDDEVLLSSVRDCLSGRMENVTEVDLISQYLDDPSPEPGKALRMELLRRFTSRS